jgi:hypothetical protein
MLTLGVITAIVLPLLGKPGFVGQKHLAHLLLWALGFDVEELEWGVGDVVGGVACVRHPAGFSGFELEVLGLTAGPGEANATTGDADEDTGAVVMDGDGFTGGKSEAQDSRAIVFEIHADVAGTETKDIAIDHILGDDVGRKVPRRDHAAAGLRGQRQRSDCEAKKAERSPHESTSLLDYNRGYAL